MHCFYLCTYLFHRLKAIRDITLSSLKTAHGDFKIKLVVAMYINEHERDRKTARLVKSKKEWQKKYTFLDVIDETISVPQQRGSMADRILKEEMPQFMEGSRTSMTRSWSLGEITVTVQQLGVKRTCSAGIKMIPMSSLLGVKTPSIQLGAQFNEQTA